MNNDLNIDSLSGESKRLRLKNVQIKAWRLIGSIFVLAIFGLFAWPLMTQQIWSPIEGRAAAPDEFLSTATPYQIAALPSASSVPSATATKAPTIEEEIVLQVNDFLLLSLSEEGNQHLFSFDTRTLIYTRISNGNWNDEGLSLHPNGLSIAFSSDRGGQWDLMEMSLLDGEIQKLSDDLAYDGDPSWSADGEWLAFEHYENDNLDIFMQPADGAIEAVRLTNNRGVDHSPTWSPNANIIAFVSDRSGNNNIWILDLDQDGDQRFKSLAQIHSPVQSDPAWSPNGQYLAWSAFVDGQWQSFYKDIWEPDSSAKKIGVGKQITWNPEGSAIAAIVEGASQTFLLGYDLKGRLLFPAMPVSGIVKGLIWGAGLASQLPASFQNAADAEYREWQINTENNSRELVVLDNVQAPFADLVIEAIPSFEALQKKLGQRLGWDLFANLENAFIPVNIPHDPGVGQDWHYTGRALSLLENLIFTDWIQAQQEEINGQIYWRIFARSVEQNGEMGRPMEMPGWDFEARINGNNESLLAGGASFDEVAKGYWVDISAIAKDFGWQRLASLSNWENFFPSARFNQFVYSQGLSWEEAMLQIISTEKLADFLNP